MKRFPFYTTLILIIIFSVSTILYLNSKISMRNTKLYSNHQNKRIFKSKLMKKNDEVVLSFVVCDSRFNESLNLLKSGLIFTQSSLHVVIFAEDDLHKKFNSTLTKWKMLIARPFTFELHKINFPEANRKDWMNLFSKCAAQRLFIPALLPHVDAMIYVDTDTLFLGPIEILWNYFTKFKATEISALALEDENPNVSWYPRFAKHPFYGKCGLNSGVMLMNLTRMREFGWIDYITPIMLRWKSNIPWGDQDIINIIFHYHERAVHELSCRYNYRSDQCMYGDACADATFNGIFVLHGSRRAFYSDKQPAFQAVHRAIEEFEIGADLSPKMLLVNMEKYLNETTPSNCGNLKDAFLKIPTETFKKHYNLPDR
ncbi:glucoside xylosyltransferase 1 isoform X1 [Bombyx mandarina]|uniref:UDP-D-xylose:beta-D-glucoside alpha-1,3-D-xylosyltransferase n=2 Tax=Bombyx mandarina TaxID=7092 RepID=A0A6J2JYH0_BOMMA|nr:glucoside xylosyltransferase 1 isoform X1 [Bombyx mandarina]